MFAMEGEGLGFGDMGEARDAVARETRIGDAAVFELDGFEERAAEALNICADDLIAQAIGIDDGAAFERGYEANDADGAGLFVDSNFRAGCHITSLFIATGDSEAAFFRLREGPGKCFSGGFCCSGPAM